jgi:formylglycine-generating enzyme required for sulfatase activity
MPRLARIGFAALVVLGAGVAGLSPQVGGAGRPATPAVSGRAPRLVTNSIGLELVWIPAGQFQMGSPPTEQGHSDKESQHEVKITRAFYLGKYEVTQGQYEKVTGANPSYFSATGDGKHLVTGMDARRFPVDGVSWEDAVAYCKKLSELPAERARGRVYRLPTEAEWEYACRAGTTTPFHFGPALSSDRANVDGTDPYGGAPRGPYLQRSDRVGSFAPNAFGLYDMHGNVWEWCQDWFGPAYYGSSPRQDPPGPPTGTGRVLRGGSWRSYPAYCRSANRASEAADDRGKDHNHGFRVALDAPGGRPE